MANINDEILDLLIKRDLLLQRVGNGLSKEVASQYIKMIDEAINSLGKVDVSLINMNKIIKEINSNIALDYSKVEDSLSEVAITEAGYVPTAINGIVAVDIMNKTLPDSLVNKIVRNSYLSDGNTIKEGFEKLDTRLQETFQNQIRLGVLNGSTTQEIISNLKPYMDGFTSNNVDSLVKTSLSTIVNNVRMDTYKENEDIFKGYQHQSVLDSRTTFICAERDNKQWDLELKPIGHKLPFKQTPIHYMCRSIILPITKSYKELGLNIDEIPVGTRSSMNGYVPANTSFSQWFDKQSKANQEKYLGKGRFELYQQGKITLSDLVNQKGKVLTIKELKGVSNVPVKATVPKIDFGYGGKFNKYVENIRDEAKIVIEKLPKPKEIGIAKVGASYYEPYKNKLMVEDSKIYFNHEYGHHIDTMIGKKTDNLFYSQSESVKKAMQEDIKSLGLDTTKGKQNIIKYLEENHYNKTEARGKIYYDAKNDYSNVISDIFDSMTKGYINGKGFAGHGKNYFKEDIYRHLENNGNMFALWSSEDKEWQKIKSIIPNMTKEFEKTMNEVINGKFD